MGLLFSKQKTNIRERPSQIPKQESISDTIKKYEYIKQTKHIQDINLILNIIQNTDWSKVEMEYAPPPLMPIPSAPPIDIPVAVEIK